MSAPAPVAWALGIIFAVLIAATILVRFLDREGGELRLRVRSWWFMIVVFAVAILIDPVISSVFLGLVCYLAFKEYLSLVPTRQVDRLPLLFAYLSIPVQLYWAHTGWYDMFVVWIPVWMMLFLPMVMVLNGRTEGFLRAVGTLTFGLMLTVFALSHTAMLLTGSDAVNGEAGGAGLLLFLVLTTQANDILQFVWGRTLGRRPIVPSVSPKKTWEGFLGGVATSAALAALTGPWLTIMPWHWAAAAGAVIAVAGFVGDVNMSAIKRDLGVKDSGGLIPGHGGILDRVDSLTYAGPVFFHFFAFFFVGGRA